MVFFICLLNVASPLAREVTIYPDGQIDPESLHRANNKPQTMLDVRKTTFFNIERTIYKDASPDNDGEYDSKNGDS